MSVIVTDTGFGSDDWTHDYVTLDLLAANRDSAVVAVDLASDTDPAQLAQLIDGVQNVVVMGDLNSSVSKLLLETPLAETSLVAPEELQPTYPAWRPSLALDHVLCSPSLKLDGYDVLDCQVSDHRPVAVQLSLAA